MANRFPMSPERVAILMATYNGGAYVGEQAASLNAQTHRHWRLWVSDDGSTDATIDTIRHHAGRRLIRVTRGPGAGFAQNFLHLLRQMPPGHYAAFCDQDDVWHPNKLARALHRLRGVQGPAMVCAATQPCNNDLQPLGPQTHQTPPDLSFRNALAQNQAPGNAIVLNPPAVAILKTASAYAWAIPAHDWWTYLCLSAIGGTLLFDPKPALLYRQHARNAIGTNTGWRARIQRAGRLFNGTYARWNNANLAALRPLRPHMPPENQRLYDQVSRARFLPLRSRLRTAATPPVQLASRPAQHAWQLAHALGCT